MISDDLYAQAQIDLKKYKKDTREGIRLRAIISSKIHGIYATSRGIGRCVGTVTEWIKRYRDTGSLNYSPGRGGKKILQLKHGEAIKNWLSLDPGLTVKEIMKRLEEELGVMIKKSALHNYIKSAGFSYITPRPKHYKQRPREVDDFKKK